MAVDPPGDTSSACRGRETPRDGLAIEAGKHLRGGVWAQTRAAHGETVAKLANRTGAPVLEIPNVRRGAVLIGFRPADVDQCAAPAGGVLHVVPDKSRRASHP